VSTRRRGNRTSLRLVASSFERPFPRPCCDVSARNRMVDRDIGHSNVVCAGDSFHSGNPLPARATQHAVLHGF
jgi:hypothetical protein